MPAYANALITIHDRARYAEYEAGFMAIFKQYGGELLAVDEAPEVLEGDWPWTRTVLLRFPDAAALHAWYDSSEYQDLMRHRTAASTGNIVVLKGLADGAERTNNG